MSFWKWAFMSQGKNWLILCRNIKQKGIIYKLTVVIMIMMYHMTIEVTVCFKGLFGFDSLQWCSIFCRYIYLRCEKLFTNAITTLNLEAVKGPFNFSKQSLVTEKSFGWQKCIGLILWWKMHTLLVCTLVHHGHLWAAPKMHVAHFGGITLDSHFWNTLSFANVWRFHIWNYLHNYLLWHHLRLFSEFEKEWRAISH